MDLGASRLWTSLSLRRSCKACIRICASRPIVRRGVIRCSKTRLLPTTQSYGVFESLGEAVGIWVGEFKRQRIGSKCLRCWDRVSGTDVRNEFCVISCRAEEKNIWAEKNARLVAGFSMGGLGRLNRGRINVFEVELFNQLKSRLGDDAVAVVFNWPGLVLKTDL